MNDIEKKQIEELARDIYEQKSCDTSFEGNCEILAYDLVTLGYRKIDEEEYNKLKNLEKYHITCEDVSEYVSSARKETARKIYKKGKELDKYFDMTVLGEYIIANFLSEENENERN